MGSAHALALEFHHAYEELAPSFGYETRTETRQFDSESPNGRLMVAVCQRLMENRMTMFNDAGPVPAEKRKVVVIIRTLNGPVVSAIVEVPEDEEAETFAKRVMELDQDKVRKQMVEFEAAQWSYQLMDITYEHRP